MTLPISGRLARHSTAALACSFGLAFIVASSCHAQGRPTAPNDAPPRLERLDEDVQPGVTTRKPNGASGTKPTEQPPSPPGQTISRDQNGNIVETQVKTGVSTYYVRPPSTPGNAQPGDMQGVGNRPAQFKIGEFDLGARKQHKTDEEPETLAPAPAPPTVPDKR